MCSCAICLLRAAAASLTASRCVNHQCFHCCLLSLQALSEEELAHVLCEPKNALVKQYSGIFAKNGVK